MIVSHGGTEKTETKKKTEEKRDRMLVVHKTVTLPYCEHNRIFKQLTTIDPSIRTYTGTGDDADKCLRKLYMK